MHHHKAEPCKYFLKGFCSKGRDCPFSHESDTKIPNFNSNQVKKSNEICSHYMNDDCKFGVFCTKLHVCKFFLENSCTMGKKCKFSHEKPIIELDPLVLEEINSISAIMDKKELRALTEIPNNLSKPNIRIIVIGRTGAGKTTLINSFANLFFETNYFEERFFAINQNFEIIDNNGTTIPIKLNCNIKEFANKQSFQVKSQQHSQTEKSNIYCFEKKNMVLTIIDTPGIGDTRGITKDRENVAKIVKGIAELQSFNAICFVHKGNDARIDPMLSYLIQEIKGILTKECLNNFILCFTHVVNRYKIDALPTIKAMGIPIDKMVYFDNDCLIPPKKLPIDDKVYEDMAQKYWEFNRKNFKRFIELSLEMTPQKTKDVEDLYETRSALMRKIHEYFYLKRTIETGEAHQNNASSDEDEYDFSLDYQNNGGFYEKNYKDMIFLIQDSLKIQIHEHYKEIQKKSIQPINKSLLEYLEYREKMIKSDQKLSQEEYDKSLAEIETYKTENQILNEIIK